MLYRQHTYFVRVSFYKTYTEDTDHNVAAFNAKKKRIHADNCESTSTYNTSNTNNKTRTDPFWYVDDGQTPKVGYFFDGFVFIYISTTGIIHVIIRSHLPIYFVIFTLLLALPILRRMHIKYFSLKCNFHLESSPRHSESCPRYRCNEIVPIHQTTCKCYSKITNDVVEYLASNVTESTNHCYMNIFSLFFFISSSIK